MSQSKSPCIIVDLDGTLVDVQPARKYVRQRPKDFDAFHTYGTTEAAVNNTVLSVMAAFNDCCFYSKPVFLTGRSERWREPTLNWFREKLPYWHGDAEDHLYMRPDGDYRKDYDLKKDLYETHVEPYFNVDFALDDSPTVVQLWRDLGIPVFVVPGWDDEV